MFNSSEYSSRSLLIKKDLSKPFHHKIAGNFQWSCEAELPTFLELGNLRIHCEKRRDADFEDEIVQDSCSLTYDLKTRRQSLTEISSLTFVAGKKTSGLEPINRLSCVEDKHFRNLCKLYELEQVTCHNLGTERKFKTGKWLVFWTQNLNCSFHFQRVVSNGNASRICRQTLSWLTR